MPRSASKIHAVTGAISPTIWKRNGQLTNPRFVLSRRWLRRSACQRVSSLITTSKARAVAGAGGAWRSSGRRDHRRGLRHPRAGRRGVRPSRMIRRTARQCVNTRPRSGRSSEPADARQQPRPGARCHRRARQAPGTAGRGGGAGAGPAPGRVFARDTSTGSIPSLGNGTRRAVPGRAGWLPTTAPVRRGAAPVTEVIDDAPGIVHPGGAAGRGVVHDPRLARSRRPWFRRQAATLAASRCPARSTEARRWEAPETARDTRAARVRANPRTRMSSRISVQ